MNRGTSGLVMVCVVLALACSSTGIEQPSSSVTSSSTTPQAGIVTLEQLEVGSLWAILHRIRQRQENDQLSEVEAYSLALGTKIKECMADHGFEYENILWERLRVPLEISELAPTDRQRSAGYGISTHVEYWYRSGLYNPEANPNIAILDRLGLEQAAAWNAALTGSAGSENSGCLQIATQDTEWRIDLSALQTELASIEREVNAHPLVSEATRQWSECMANAEYVYATPKDIFGELQQAITPLIRRLEALDPRPSSLDGFPKDLRIALDELVSHELTVAEIDLECREIHLNWAIQTAQPSVHERFVSQNPALLTYLEEAS